MSPDTICKTILQYNKEPISEENMKKLQEIANDYNKVKNYVYKRFGGIKSLAKIYPGYTVQNEMTSSGLREQLNMPSVYFYLAIFDALGDIKNQWTQTKSRVLQAIKESQNLTEEESHYLKFVLKVNNSVEAILNDKPVILPKKLQQKYELLAEQVDIHKMGNYLKRQVRKHLRKLHTDVSDGFSITERAYRYADHGIYLAIKEKRKRIFIPLTDGNQYTRQIKIKLNQTKNGVTIQVPIDVQSQSHEDYQNKIGVSIGMFVMLTTENGQAYGTELGTYVIEEAEWIQKKTISYRRNKQANSGRQKYFEQKRRKDAALHTYINAELNRFLREEKPQIIYIPKLPPNNKAGNNKRYNRNISMWQRGYIRQRLTQKCLEHSIEMIEVFGKNISSECSNCGSIGKKEEGIFTCSQCGFQIEEKINAARNARNRGETQT